MYVFVNNISMYKIFQNSTICTFELILADVLVFILLFYSPIKINFLVISYKNWTIMVLRKLVLMYLYINADYYFTNLCQINVLVTSYWSFYCVV